MRSCKAYFGSQEANKIAGCLRGKLAFTHIQLNNAPASRGYSFSWGDQSPLLPERGKHSDGGTTVTSKASCGWNSVLGHLPGILKVNHSTQQEKNRHTLQKCKEPASRPGWQVEHFPWRSPGFHGSNLPTLKGTEEGVPRIPASYFAGS